MWWAISVVGYKMGGMKRREAFFGGFFVGLDKVKIDDGGDFSFS